MGHIEVIGAMEEEIAGLRTVHAESPWRDRVIIRRTGVGKVNAALAVADAKQRGAQCIVVVGTAGAIAPKLRIGDVIIVHRAVQHDV
ncbi:5'-methylthioadenosine/adenosylhomocysteine nucleosidase, partial [Candidatus Uhrbacteria bacterium]|nr:5'-methylthioadenosine/adenosylhomocysteine nucleosidase [Candidatus Uhrbacteria bacterium]